jgi:parallel beta-helix repeat protein
MIRNPVIRKEIAFTFMILFVGVSILPSIVGTIEKKIVITSFPSRGYIQSLIDNASDGDTIFIPSGTYYENIIVNKSISLIGENKDTTIIDGGESGTVVSISADWVNISRFTIENSSWSDSGIKISSNYNIIKETSISENNFGIRLNSNSNNNTIINNFFTSNDICISLSFSGGNNITGNLFNRNYGDHIYLKDSSNNNITGNEISENNNYRGIVLDGSFQNAILGNTISSYYAISIYLKNSDNNSILGNIVSSWEAESISLDDSSYNMIIDNIINSKDNDGIYLSTSCNNAIIDNTITSTNIQGGIYLGSSNNNFISDNSLINSGLLIEKSYPNNISNNSCNGKSLVYLEDELNIVITIDAGQVILVHCDNITVKNQELSNTSVGIELLDTHNTQIYDNKFLKCRFGILVLETSNDNLLAGNNILDSVYSIYLSESCSNTIANTVIMGDRIALEVSRGITIDYSDDNSIIGNTIYAHMWGIYLSNSMSNTISNNTVYINGTIFGECDIGVWESENNIISFNTLSSRSAAGITLRSWSNKNRIFKNNIIECGGCGIIIDGNINSRGCKNNVISENIITHDAGDGIHIRWGCELNFIEKNNISSNGGHGVSLSINCENTTILGNKITSNEKNGILVDENSNHTNISGNIINYNGESGVFITKEFVYVYWNSDYVTISENNISFNKKYGVFIDGNYHKIFANNFIKNGKNAFFIKRKPFFEVDTWCKWSYNYWEDLGYHNSKIITGRILLFSGHFIDYFFLWIQFDRHPAQEPYDILLGV